MAQFCVETNEGGDESKGDEPPPDSIDSIDTLVAKLEDELDASPVMPWAVHDYEPLQDLSRAYAYAAIPEFARTIASTGSLSPTELGWEQYVDKEWIRKELDDAVGALTDMTIEKLYEI